jgi:hypothetical protein
VTDEALKANRDWLYLMLEKLVVAVETGKGVPQTAARCRSLLQASAVMYGSRFNSTAGRE